LVRCVIFKSLVGLRPHRRYCFDLVGAPQVKCDTLPSGRNRSEERLSYQDALFKDRPVRRGGRGCEERWALIQPHLPTRGLLLDVGSDLGYFPIRALLENPDLGAVSLEGNRDSVEMQGAIARSHTLSRLCVLQGMVNGVVADSWRRGAGDRFDLTLLFSVIHWFDDPAQVVADLFAMTDRLIVEMVDPRDVGACGHERTVAMGDPARWLREVTGHDPVLLGRCARHTSDVPSHVLLVQRDQAAVAGRGDAPAPSSVALTSLLKVGRLVWPDPHRVLHAVRAESRTTAALPSVLDGNLAWTQRGIALTAPTADRGGRRAVQWTVGGTASLTAKLQRSDEDASFAFTSLCLRAWARGETTWANADTYRMPFAGRVAAGVGKLVRRVLPSRVYGGLRAALSAVRRR
jgi:hypothetical protein